MSNEEKLRLSQDVIAGLDRGYGRMLRYKALLDRCVITADDNGMPREVSAKALLKKYSRHKAPAKS